MPEILLLCFGLASHTDVFRGARISSLPRKACLTENSIPLPLLANHIAPSKFWKVDLDPQGNLIILLDLHETLGKFYGDIDL